MYVARNQSAAYCDRKSRSGKRKHFVAIAAATLILSALFLSIAAAPIRTQTAPAQSPSSQTQPPQSPATPAPGAPPTPAQPPATQPQPAPAPDWQTAAGGPQAFDVVSVKQNKSGLPPSGDPVNSNVPLGPQDLFTPTGGLLSATNMPLFQYMIFAYKLTPNQVQAVMAQLPKWATANRYDVQARVAGNPTKDQFRMMMQALLADRFKLAVHYEMKQVPVLGLVLDKPGKLGPQIQRHPDDSPCSTAIPTVAQGAVPTVAGGFPEPCGAVAGLPASTSGRIRFGARNMTMTAIATFFSIPQLSGADRPVIDKTGLPGTYDFFIEFTPEINGPLPPGATFQPDPNGPTFQEAMKEQLGMKLESQNGSVQAIVIDHVEEPSEN
jgi:uncharacterized protein (TIGR03435 family)